MPSTLTVRLVGGPTAVLAAGLRLLTDPTFDPPGEHGGGLTKLTGPAVTADDVGAIDAVLLSHDHHSDNLDPGGRAFLPRAGRTLTTTAGAERLGGNAVGLEPWATARARAPGRRRRHGHRGSRAARSRGQRARHGAGDRLRARRRRRPDALRQRRQRLGRRRARDRRARRARSSSRSSSAAASACRTASTAPTSRSRPTPPRRRPRSSAPAPSCPCTSRAGRTSRRARTSCARPSRRPGSPTGSWCPSRREGVSL